MPKPFPPLPGTPLPIFYQAGESHVLVYAAGFLVRVEKQNWQELLHSSSEWQILRDHAIQSNREPARWQSYTPFSLHIYLTQKCNLACSYCFSKPTRSNQTASELTTEAILSAAELVSENCCQWNSPMTVVFHGGGEPTQDKRIEPLAHYIRDICEHKNIQSFFYLATNGVMRAEIADKMCGLFDLIGLSCDGPPDIQDAQRPTRAGTGSSKFIENTAKVFNEHHQEFEVRVTLTKASWPRMPDIAAYLIEELHPQAINVELCYRTSSFPVDENDFEGFIDTYFKAQEVCQRSKVPWRTSRLRPGQQHRQYCHILQNTLQIIPGDAASMCFLDSDAQESTKSNTQIGVYQHKGHTWHIDQAKLNKNRKIVLRKEAYCKDCFAQTHCHRSCPDRCPIAAPQKLPDLHCKLNRQLLRTALESEGQTLAEHCKENNLTIAGKEIIAC